MTLHTSSSQRPLVCIKSALRITQYKAIQTRSVSAGTLRYRAPPPPPPRHDPWAPLEPRRMLTRGGDREK